MQEEQFSNREIREMFKDIQLNLTRIENQTLRTNGRVSSLEVWKGYTAGAVAVIILIGLPILGWVLLEVINLLQK